MTVSLNNAKEMLCTQPHQLAELSYTTSKTTSYNYEGSSVCCFCIAGCELDSFQKTGFMLFSCTIDFFFLTDLKEKKEGWIYGWVGGVRE
jgi:hypothetical protein